MTNKLRQKVSGKKTYLLASAAIAYLIGASLDWWPLNEQVMGIFAFLGLTTLRAGIAKAKAQVSALTLGLLLTGCAHLAPGTPDNPSPYADKVLFDAEQATVTGYDLLQVFVSWELNNRAALSKFPAVTKAADKIRAHSEDWIATVNRLRDAYAANPTPANRNALIDGLRVLRQAIAEATSYLVTYGPAHSL